MVYVFDFLIFLAGALLLKFLVPNFVKDPLYQKLCYFGAGLIIVILISL